jgi:rhodanese-related sulfurtransferase
MFTLLKAVLPALTLMTLNACSPSNPSLQVSLDEGRALLESGGALLVDIREPSEHAHGVAPGMLLLPMSQLSARINELPRDPAQPLLLICNTQNRSARVAAQLHAAGLTHVRFVDGGMSGWARRGWPMVRPGSGG